MPKKRDVFISYARSNAITMRYVRKVLQEAGLSTWTDHEEIEPGHESWINAIEDGIAHSCCVVVILTPASIQSKWVRQERLYAEQLGKKIFPILAEDTIIPIDLNTYQYADIRGDDDEIKIQRLIKAIKSHCQKQSVKKTTRRRIKPNLTDETTPPIQPIDAKLLRALSQSVNAVSDLIPGPLYRACLFLVNDPTATLYVVTASEGFTDEELGLEFKLNPPQGIVGLTWTSHTNSLADLSDKDAIYLKDVLHLSEEQIAITRHVKEIIGVPIFAKQRPDRVIGVLVLDSQDEAYNEQGEKNSDHDQILDELEDVANYIAELLPVPLPTTINYRDQLHLQAVLRIARLIPPLNVPIRSYVFLVNNINDELVMIAASSNADSALLNLRVKRKEGAVGSAWESEVAQTTDKANLAGAATGSVLAVPIYSPGTSWIPSRVIGVLALDSDVNINTSGLGKDETKTEIERLAQLISKVLSRSVR